MKKYVMAIAALAAALAIGRATLSRRTLPPSSGETARAMGADGLNSVTYSGTAADVNFLQTRNINGPWPLRPITSYTRAIDLTTLGSRATGSTMNQGLFGGPPVPGTFNQGITPQSAVWLQQLDYWVTPWGFLKGAAANKATIRTQKIKGKNYSIVTWSPPLKAPSGVAYRVNGYITDDHLIDRVETWVDHDMLGDMLVDTSCSDTTRRSALKVPTKIVQQRGGFTYFMVTVEDAKANPADLASCSSRLPHQRDAVIRPAPGGPPAGGRGGGAERAVSIHQARGRRLQISGTYNARRRIQGPCHRCRGPQSIERGEAIVDE